MDPVSKVKKRTNEIVDFDKEKIANAILRSFKSVEEGDFSDMAEELTDIVVRLITIKEGKDGIPSVEDIQDIVEKVLMESGNVEVARHFIIYRHEHKKIRDAKKAIIGKDTASKSIDINALKILEARYLRKDEDGTVIETPEDLFGRVAKNIASAEKLYDEDSEYWEERFYSMMSKLDFLPNSPTLMNAGNDLQQLAACFVLPVEDSMEGIFTSLKNAALIHKSGGGTGFSFSRLRPKNDHVKSTQGVASGPLSFMKVFDSATEVIKQGGKRRGANMGIMKVDHPDILDFITAKENNDVLNNFNISVGLTENFMEAVLSNSTYALKDPRTGEEVESLNAKTVFDLIVTMAWKNGEPGMVFLDRINKFNPTPNVGEIESTNPCGEQPLLPYEACNLGSINLANFVKDKQVDFQRLGEVVGVAVRFLDDVIDVGKYPLAEIEEMVKSNRKIGLGIMGFADMLFQMEIPYNSDKGIETAKVVMKFIRDVGRKESEALAKKKGVFPNFKGSMFDKADMPNVRNATITTIAPTGTLSMIANASSGVEPLFALSFIKNVMDGNEMLIVNKHFEDIAKERGFYSEELMRKIANKGSISSFDEIPEDLKKVFVTAFEISPEWHLRMQAAFQEYTDNAVSKTVNFGKDATLKDVEDVFILAYNLGCKGVTVYRDGSRSEQVLNIESVNKKKEETKVESSKLDAGSKTYPKDDDMICPDCGNKMIATEGCATCPDCGYSMCSSS